MISPFPRGSAVEPGASLSELVATMAQLRVECPWDAKQTHASLVEYLIEEAYEVVEAIELTDDRALREELGDLLLQIVFHAQIASEAGDWTIDDVIAGINDKLIERHPHVFADDVVGSAEEVEANWHARKARKKGRVSVADGIPQQLPALLRAAKIHARSAALGLPAHDGRASAVIEALPDDDALGHFLYDLVGAAQARGWDAEAALRHAMRARLEVIRTATMAKDTTA